MTALNFTGAAAATQLNGSINNSTTTIVVDDGSTYPSSNFVIVIDRGTASEEKVLVGSRSGNSFSSCTRAYDGTSAAAHSDNAVVQHTLPAAFLDALANMLSAGTTAGDLLYATASEVYSRLAIGTAGQALKVNAGATAPEWGQVAAAGIADGAVTNAKLGLTELRVRRVAAQSLSASSTATISWDTEDSDAAAMHSAGNITIPTTGMWNVVAKVDEASGGSDIIVSVRFKTSSGTTTESNLLLGQLAGTGGSTVLETFNLYAESGAVVYVEVVEGGGLGAASLTGTLWMTLLAD